MSDLWAHMWLGYFVAVSSQKRHQLWSNQWSSMVQLWFSSYLFIGCWNVIGWACSDTIQCYNRSTFWNYGFVGHCHSNTVIEEEIDSDIGYHYLWGGSVLNPMELHSSGSWSYIHQGLEIPKSVVVLIIPLINLTKNGMFLFGFDWLWSTHFGLSVSFDILEAIHTLCIPKVSFIALDDEFKTDSLLEGHDASLLIWQEYDASLFLLQ